MTYFELRDKIDRPYFTLADAGKFFPNEDFRVQLHRFVKKGYLISPKRGLYLFPKAKIDELELARLLYSPSYISLETALNYYGMIPDIPLSVTSVTTVTTKKIKTDFGQFYYQKIKPELFFGYKIIPAQDEGVICMASPEKALLDFEYLRGKKQLSKLRLDKSVIDKKIYDQFNHQF